MAASISADRRDPSMLHPQVSPNIMLVPKAGDEDDSCRRSYSSLSPNLSHNPSVSNPGSIRSLSLSARALQPDQLQHMGFGQQARHSVPYAASISSSMMAGPIPLATPENDYLGFCKGAWKLQNGDRKGAMEKCKEADAWSRNASGKTSMSQHLKCRQNRCAFRSSLNSTDADLVWDKVFTYEDKGMKLRWAFLAKSHVPQRVVLQNNHAYKCLFCVYMGMGGRAGVYVGLDYYLDHINHEHRSRNMNEIVTYKTCCVADRIAADGEEFDINLWPSTAFTGTRTESWLSDSLLENHAYIPRHRSTGSSSFSDELRMSGAFPDAIPENKLGEAAEDVQRAESSKNGHSLAPVHAEPISSDMHQQSNQFQYEPWEDNPEEIWGSAPKPSGSSQQRKHSNSAHGIPARSHVRPQQSQRLEPQDSGTAGLPPPVSPISAPPQTVPPNMDLQMERMSISNDADFGISDIICSIIQVFREASDIINEMKRHAALQTDTGLQYLEEIVLDAPLAIEKERQRGNARLGHAFEAGDHVAIIALQQIALRLHNMLNMLRNVAMGKMVIEFGSLADAADAGRVRTTTALYELRQRLTQSGPSGFNAPAPIAYYPPNPDPAQRSASYAHQNSNPHSVQIYGHVWKDPYFPDSGERQASATAMSSDPNQQGLGGNADDSDSRRRNSRLGSLGFLKDRRTKSGGQTKDLKPTQGSPAPQSKIDIAGPFKRRLKLDLQSQKAVQQHDDTESTSSGAVELDSMPVVGVGR